MNCEGMPQIMESRLEVGTIAALQTDAIADDPEVAFRGLPRDRLSPPVEEEGSGRRGAPGECDALVRIVRQGGCELRSHRQEPALEEFRVPNDKAVR